MTPKSQVNRITLETYGQRQAILFEAVRILGVRRYKFSRRSFTDGKLVIAFVPVVNDLNKVIKAINHTPILENSRKIGRIMKSDGGSDNE